MTIKLSQTEIDECLSLAQSRNSKAPGVVSRSLGNNTDTLYSHQMGVFSEYAVAKHFGVEIDKTIYKNGGDKGKEDLHIPDIGYIEVKSVGHRYKSQPWIRVEVDHFNEKVDYYIVCAVNVPAGEVEFLGWTDRATIKNRPKEKCRNLPEYPWNYMVKNPNPWNTFPTNPPQPSVAGSTKVIYVSKKDAKTATDVAPSCTTFSAREPQLGSVVRLKSGGPEMTVVEMKDMNAKCLYYINNGTFEFLTAPFPALTLVKA